MFAGLGLFILSCLSIYWVIELFSLMKLQPNSWLIAVGFLVLFCLAFISSFFTIFILFLPFFVEMEMGGSKSWRNYFIFFSILMCFPIIYLILYPTAFINGYYSWISLAVFGYGAGHTFVMYLKER